MSIVSIVGDKRALKMGDEGEAVHRVQLALAILGYKLKGKGYFGAATDTAVEDFQRLHDLFVDGEVGPITAAAIDQALKTGVPTPRPVIEHMERPLWLLAGLKYLGTEERPGSGNNPEILEWAKEEGGSIAKVYTADSIPWCALFANHTLTSVGLKGTGSLWALDFNNSKQLVTLQGPAVGAFAPMKRQGGGHVAIVVGRTRDGNLACIGGNQSDAVTIAAFPPNRPVSFRWPASVGKPEKIGFSSLPVVNSQGMSIDEQ